MARGPDLTGQTVGMLAVVRRDGHNRWKSVLWLCRCRCGKECHATTQALRSGHAASCGCHQFAAISHDLAGRRFGKLVAVRPTEERGPIGIGWLCRCDCGREVVRPASHLLAHYYRSCGQCGIYRTARDPSRPARVLALHREAVMPAEIARREGISASRVYQILRQRPGE